MTTHNLTPDELARLDQWAQNNTRTLDSLIHTYRGKAGTDGTPVLVDQALFAAALAEEMTPAALGELLVCAIARLAGGPS